MKSKIKEKSVEALFAAAATISIVAVVLICFYLFASGIPTISEIGVKNFLLGKEWSPSTGVFGIFPMIIGSLYVTAGAIICGVPMGILCAIFIAKFCPKTIKPFVKQGVSLLAGIPSIIYGFFGLMMILPIIQYVTDDMTDGKGVLAASIILGVMILPTVITISVTSIEAVESSYYEGALGLGATHERAVFRVVVPAAKSGIIASVVLGLGRAIGETMAVILVAGNAPIIPTSVFDKVRTLTANVILEIGYASGLHLRALIATGMVLFVFILGLNLLLGVLTKGRKAS